VGTGLMLRAELHQSPRSNTLTRDNRRYPLLGFSPRRRGHQRIDQLTPKSHDLVVDPVAPDHSVGETRLERPIDHDFGPREVFLAAGHEIAQRQILFSVASACVQHAHVLNLNTGMAAWPHPDSEDLANPYGNS
jgi:hypothetical protein